MEIVRSLWWRWWSAGRPWIDGVGRGNPVPFIAMTKIQSQGTIPHRPRGVWAASGVAFDGFAVRGFIAHRRESRA